MSLHSVLRVDTLTLLQANSGDGTGLTLQFIPRYGGFMSYRRYWVALAIVILGSFAVLGSVGRKLISEAPPIPDVYTTDGQLLFTGSGITDGQGVWQSVGGQEIGTVWGHGAYVAPDWSADWLHRESEILLDRWAQSDGAATFAALDADKQSVLQA